MLLALEKNTFIDFCGMNNRKIGRRHIFRQKVKQSDGDLGHMGIKLKSNTLLLNGSGDSTLRKPHYGGGSLQLSTSPHTSVIKKVLICSTTPTILENILCMRQQNLIFTNLAMVSPHYFDLILGLVPHHSSWFLLVLMLFPLKKDCSVVERWNMDEGIWVLGFGFSC